jgi:ferredoxin
MAKVSVSDECIGCETCVGICPDVFEMVDGKATVIDGADLSANMDEITEAAESCPAEAITAEE